MRAIDILRRERHVLANRVCTADHEHVNEQGVCSGIGGVLPSSVNVERDQRRTALRWVRMFLIQWVGFGCRDLIPGNAT